MSIVVLALLFFAVATLYAMAGFGGGSSYLALLTLAGISHTYLPSIALSCNLIVATGGAIHFVRAGHASLRLASPFLLSALPTAYLIGRLEVGATLFTAIAALCLALAGVRMLFTLNQTGRDAQEIPTIHLWIGGLIGGSILAGLAGLIGIGGGIFLAPVLTLIRWGTAKQIAATASLFICMSSFGGLWGHITRHGNLAYLIPYLPLCLAVFLGGQLGSYVGAVRAPFYLVRLATATVLLIAATFMATNLLWR